eukprot:6490685-Amphidinium_carterae.1
MHAGTSALTCDQAGLQIALRREAARALHQKFAAVFLDLQKAYEHVGHAELAAAYATTDLPWAVLQGALRLYSAPRQLQFNGEITDAGNARGSTLTPGCSLATRLMMILVLPLMQQLQALSPLIRPTNDVDDIEFSVAGSAQEVLDVTTEAVRLSMTWLRDKALPVSTHKCVLLTDISTALMARFAEVGAADFNCQDTTRYLGTQANASNRRRTAVLQMRLKTTRKRYARLRIQRQGGKPAKLLRSVNAATWWGTSVTGVAPSTLTKHRRWIARLALRLNKRTKVELVYPLHPEVKGLDPQVLVQQRQMLDWQKLVSSGQVPETEIWAAIGQTCIDFLDCRSLWAKVRGPASATLATLLQAKGSMQTPSHWMLASRAIRAKQDGAERLKALMLKAIRANDREVAGLMPHATMSPIRRAISKLEALPAHCLVQHLAGG